MTRLVCQLALPEELCACLPHLRTLGVAGAGLRALPERIGLRPRVFFLKHTQYNWIIPFRAKQSSQLSAERPLLLAFGHTGELATLEALHADSNMLDALPQSLSTLSRLATLTLSRNAFWDVPPALPAALRTLNLVTTYSVPDT